MATPNTVSSYPIEYFEILRKATEKRKEITLSSSKKANDLRLQLYGFRAALVNDPTADQELALLANGLIMRVEEKNDGAVLSIEMRENDETIQAIRDAL